ncbi:MAG: dTMP kinase [Nanoarchaeota archaeon]|nr:dTMP kinase [Nanoarchaeota archaeon]
MKGRLIVIDGADGSGKKTQAELLKTRLEKEGKDVAFFDFPVYGSFYGKLVGKYLRGEFGSLDEISPHLVSLLYALDRLAERDNMLKALEKGKTVLCNRYVQSNMAYQSAKLPASGQDDFIRWIEEMEYGQNRLPKPDLVIFLDVPPGIGQKLVDKKGHRDYVGNKRDLHEQDASFLERVHSLYMKLAKKNGWAIISCVKDGEIMPREEIHERVFCEVTAGCP